MDSDSGESENWPSSRERSSAWYLLPGDFILMNIGADIINTWIEDGLNNFELHLLIHCGKEQHNREAEYIAIQYWAPSSSRNSEGYLELKTPDQLHTLVCLDQEQKESTTQRIASYRSRAAAHVYRLQEGEELLGVPGRVFKSKRVEESPNIYHYTAHEYPLKDFALNCGIQASLCLPLFMTKFSGNPDGVVEILFTSDAAFHYFKRLIYEKYLTDTNNISTTLTLSERMQVCRYGASLNGMPVGAPEEIKHVLTAVCQKHSLPLAQSWFISTDGFRCSFVMDHASSLDLGEAIYWNEFKEAASNFCSYLGDGLVSKTFESFKSYFCKDITELSICSYPLVHYVRNCGSIACVTIYLHSLTPHYKDCVLEFFVPHVENSHPQIVLNSLFATLEQYLRIYTVRFVEQELFVEVINSSMHHSETEYFKIADPVIYLPHHEGSQKKRAAVSQQPLSKQSAVDDGEQHGENILDVKEKCSTISKISRTCGNAEHAIYEESLVEDVGDAISTKSQPFVTKNSLARVQCRDEEEISVLDCSDQQLRLQDSMQHEVIILGAEKDETTILSINTTCIEGSPKEEKKSEADISFESIREHFGTPLNDAAVSFGVSRSTFKRICRGYGIKRWKPGKRRMGDNISSKVRRRNDEETSRRNFSTSDMLSKQETSILVPTEQEVNEMTVKATYEGVTIMFDLLDSSGMRDLEDNVIERLHLDSKKFTIKFQDDDGDWILIACDKDVRKCMKISRLSKKTSIKMLIEQPIHYRAP